MPSAKTVGHKAPHITKGDVFGDLGLSHAEALEAKVKADIWRELVAHIDGLHLKQKDLAIHLDVHQPDVSNLLSGKLSKFSVGTLIQFAVKLEMDVHVSFTAPKTWTAKTLKIPALHAKEAKPRHQKEHELVGV